MPAGCSFKLDVVVSLIFTFITCNCTLTSGKSFSPLSLRKQAQMISTTFSIKRNAPSASELLNKVDPRMYPYKINFCYEKLMKRYAELKKRTGTWKQFKAMLIIPKSRVSQATCNGAISLFTSTSNFSEFEAILPWSVSLFTNVSDLPQSERKECTYIDSRKSLFFSNNARI